MEQLSSETFYRRYSDEMVFLYSADRNAVNNHLQDIRDRTGWWRIRQCRVLASANDRQKVGAKVIYTHVVTEQKPYMAY